VSEKTTTQKITLMHTQHYLVQGRKENNGIDIGNNKQIKKLKKDS